MKRNENGWVAQDRDTLFIYDRDLVLSKLIERIKRRQDIEPEVTYTKNWFRGTPWSECGMLEQRRDTFKANKDLEGLARFDAKIARGRPSTPFDPDEWPITPMRHVELFLKRKAGQLKALLTQ